mmetsp:Transcript_21480/g.49981  ORF Transcript_21480/g.49981 Transcript_21480/m.49981 type:complete len:305 (-) Transcript_21480:186-1100(-)
MRPVASALCWRAVLAVCAFGSASSLELGKSPAKGKWEICSTPDAGSSQPSIPKIVHQTYKSATLPPRLLAYRNTWQRYLPDWEHKLWLDDDNRNLVKDHYPWFLATYDGYDKTIKRVDAARLFMMHRYGGVYADTDLEVLQDPTPLFSGEHDLFLFAQSEIKCGKLAQVVVPQNEATVGVIPNALMASAPGHPFWIYLAMKLMSAKKEALVMWATGPSRFTETLSQYQVEYPHARVAIYAKDYWSPFKWGDNGCESTNECKALFPDSFIISHWTGTWNHCEKGTCLQNDEFKDHYHRNADSVRF